MAGVLLAALLAASGAVALSPSAVASGDVSSQLPTPTTEPDPEPTTTTEPDSEPTTTTGLLPTTEPVPTTEDTVAPPTTEAPPATAAPVQTAPPTTARPVPTTAAPVPTTTTVLETFDTTVDLLVPGDGTLGAESTTTTDRSDAPVESSTNGGISDGTLVGLIIGGLLLVAVLVAVLTWRYWAATRPVPATAGDEGDPAESDQEPGGPVSDGPRRPGDGGDAPDTVVSGPARSV